jgi:hypothetical protein
MERFETRHHLFEEKYKMKMNELKLLAIKNQGQSLKGFTQHKLSFSKHITYLTTNLKYFFLIF